MVGRCKLGRRWWPDVGGQGGYSSLLWPPRGWAAGVAEEEEEESRWGEGGSGMPGRGEQGAAGV
jgi:hypothetical protein